MSTMPELSIMLYHLRPCPPPPGQDDLPPNAQVAFQQSEIAAWNIWSLLTKTLKPLTFRYTQLGEAMTLGEDMGSFFGLQGLVKLEGPSASLARRLLYIVRMPTDTQRRKAARDWYVPSL